jgi:hypothetical protein
MSKPWEKLEEMIAEMPLQKGPRLSFPQMCGAFYALQRGFKRVVVAKAFGLSPSSASLLANCRRAGTRHYARVAEEFMRLGEEAFRDRYFDDDILTRLQRFRMHVPEPHDIRTRLGDNKAAKYQGLHWLESPHRVGPFQIEIAYRPAGDDNWMGEIGSPPLPARWAWRDLEYPDRWSCKTIRTSSEAYDAAHTDNAIPSPRLTRS